MPEIHLRPAVEADMSLIRQWVRDYGINPFGLKYARFTVAESNGDDLVGCVQLKPHRDGTVELASLAVVEGWRGNGAARALIEAAIEAHNGPLYLMCRSSLGVLYEKFGFRALDEDEMPPYYRRINRLASIFNRFRDTEEHLLIMRR